jgi:hypothetical protein
MNNTKLLYNISAIEVHCASYLLLAVVQYLAAFLANNLYALQTYQNHESR